MKISNELKKAIARAKTAIESKVKIETAIDTAIRLQPAAEARLQAALENLGESEAEAALLGESAASESERASLTDARTIVDALQARVGALRRKLDASRLEMQVAAEELETARVEFSVGAMGDCRERLERAATEFTAALRYVGGVAAAVGDVPVERAIQAISIENPMAREFLVHMEAYQVVDGQRIPAPIWQGDTAAEAAFRTHSEPFLTVAALGRAMLELGRATE